MSQKQYGAQPRRPHRPRPDVLLREPRAARPRPVGPHHDRGRQRRPRSTPGSPRPAIPGAPVATGVYPNPVHSTHVPGQGRPPGRPADQLSLRYSLYQRRRRQLARRGRARARPAPRPASTTSITTVALSNTWTLSHADGERDARRSSPTATWRRRRPIPVGPGGQHRGRRVLRHALGQPDAARRTRCSRSSTTLSHQAGAHALRAGVDFLYNDDTITYPRSIRGAYTFSSLANFLSGVYNNAGFTQTFGDPVVAQTNPNLGVYVAGRVERRLAA